MKIRLPIISQGTVLLRVFLILVWLVALISSCTSVRVSQDYDTSFTFDAADTFGWNKKLQDEDSDLLKGDELLARRFKGTIEDVLVRRGFRLDERPFFLVSYTFSITSKFQIDPGDSHFGYGFSRYGYYRGVGLHSHSSIRQYDQGKLVINIHSSMTNQLVWKGIGTREVFLHSNHDQISQSVKEMVEAVLAQFPPVGL